MQTSLSLNVHPSGSTRPTLSGPAVAAFAAFCVALIFGAPGPAAGGSAATTELNVDQQNLADWTGGWSIALMAPVGQSFIPSQDRLNVVEILVGTDELPGANGLFTIWVHADSLGGPVVGTSQQRWIPSPTFGDVTFIFGTPVDVEPGRTYVFEPVRLAGTSNLLLYGNTPSTYGSGDGVILGTSRPDIDFRFRVGFDSGAPVLPVSWSSIKWRFR